MRTLEIELSEPQAAVIASTDRFVDLEGAVRSGKTRLGAEKTANVVVEYPGIHCLITRYKEKDLWSKVVPVWRTVAAEHGIVLRWNAKEQCDEVKNPATGQYESRVYLIGLKSSDNASTAGKVRGLTLGFIWADQAEEIPLEVFNELKLRLSQPNVLNQLLLTPNPPGPEHWINHEFPADNTRPKHVYVRTSIYDNAHNLNPGTVEANEESFPEGSAFHATMLLGKRGLSLSGVPVYKGYYFPFNHEHPVEYDPRYPLLEAWDFGREHPAVVWGQLPPGRFHLLGGAMAWDMGLADFVAIVLSVRSQWFGTLSREPMATCDGSGANRNKDGLTRGGKEENAVTTLAGFGIGATPCRKANTEMGRRKTIEALWGWMRRFTDQGDSAFKVNPRFHYITKQRIATEEPILTRGFTAGYVWPAPVLDHNRTRVPPLLPKKDGFFDHTQNCVEYLLCEFGNVPGTEAEIAKEQAKAERAVTARDHDPDDQQTWRRRGNLTHYSGRV